MKPMLARFLGAGLAASVVCSAVAEPQVRLRYASFDPLAGPPAVPAALADTGSGHIVLVQFAAPPTDAQRAAIAAAGGGGARIVHFLPDHTVVVVADPALRRALAAIAGVRWVGPYHPAYRLDASLLPRLLAPNARAPSGFDLYALEAFDEPGAARIAHALVAAGAHVTGVGGRLVIAAMTPAQLATIVRSDDLNFVDPHGPAGLDMDIARQLGHAHPFLSSLGFTGQNVRAEVLDTGLRTTHQAIQNPPPLLHGPNGSSQFHGTAVYGIVFGDGTGDPQATGMLPTPGQGIFAAYTTLQDFGGTVSRGQHTAQLVDPTGPYRAVFQTSSIGSPQVAQYTTISAALDDITWTYDFLITQTISNTGNQLARPQAWSKNVITVSGINHYNTLTKADDSAAGSAYGPAQDGRIKPDLCHIYDSVYTISDASNSAYAQFGGDSASTPIVAGYMGLMFQMWHDQVFSGFGGGKSVFDDRPALATIRALAINSAAPYDWNQGGPNATITRAKQGWGMPDVRNLYHSRQNALIVNADQPLTQGQARQHAFDVPAGAAALRITMVYTDRAGNPAAAIDRINDLDLHVTSPTGVEYWGNVGLWQSIWSAPGGVPNAIDPIENVFLPDPAPGLWTLEIIGREIVQDAYPPTPAIDAAYGLVAAITPESCYADCDASGTLNVQDYICFQTKFALGDPYADCDNNGVRNVNDYICFQTSFALGCP